MASRRHPFVTGADIDGVQPSPCKLGTAALRRAMNKRFPICLLSLLLASMATAQSMQLDFSSLGGSLLSFSGTNGSLSFTPGTGGFDFQIASSNLSGLVGLDGSISNVFTIGTITPEGPGQQAPVSGTGTFSIYDGSSATLTGSISWNLAMTSGTQGALNPLAAPNLSNFSYSGSNLALQELAADTSGISVLSFQFIPSETLTQLSSGGSAKSTSFSGSVTAIPEPGEYALVLQGALPSGRRCSEAGPGGLGPPSARANRIGARYSRRSRPGHPSRSKGRLSMPCLETVWSPDSTSALIDWRCLEAHRGLSL